VFVCLSVNTVTPEPLKISSRNFQGIILRSKGGTSSKRLYRGVSGGGWRLNVSGVLVCKLTAVSRYMKKYIKIIKKNYSVYDIYKTIL